VTKGNSIALGGDAGTGRDAGSHYTVSGSPSSSSVAGDQLLILLLLGSPARSGVALSGREALAAPNRIRQGCERRRSGYTVPHSPRPSRVRSEFASASPTNASASGSHLRGRRIRQHLMLPSAAEREGETMPAVQSGFPLQLLSRYSLSGGPFANG
jgi:hypothetical protein